MRQAPVVIYPAIRRSNAGLAANPSYSAEVIDCCLRESLCIYDTLQKGRGEATIVPLSALSTRAGGRYLIECFGDQYRDYMKRVGSFLPKLPAVPRFKKADGPGERKGGAIDS
ncbi:MAG: hypothetical protein ACR2JB_14960 [Bryobacteraceae bacterium]